MLHRKLAIDQRLTGRPARRKKDVCKFNLRASSIVPSNQEAVNSDRVIWRSILRTDIIKAESKREAQRRNENSSTKQEKSGITKQRHYVLLMQQNIPLINWTVIASAVIHIQAKTLQKSIVLRGRRMLTTTSM